MLYSPLQSLFGRLSQAE